ncbi:hypothetical protein L1987_70417 [Smallanthus sonchifolius]|uniref:Uncharacterized protein n=1 Tax=Smallanthus sonchifolius TaxID=185202 RepID=A0ACB9APV0_9ASTR|nr:hypothetical protein L1987_70417 [Smallanthus sonchifolius]
MKYSYRVLSGKDGSARSMFEVPCSYGYALITTDFKALLMDLRDPKSISCVAETRLPAIKYITAHGVGNGKI